MAEVAIGFAASVAGLAAFGIQIVTTLNTFATSYMRAEQQINDLTASVSLTSNILDSIGKNIKEYEEQFKLTVDNYISTRDACQKNFDTLYVALKLVKKEESEKKLPTGREKKVIVGGDGRIRVWDKMMHAMGGADALKDLVLSIETSKSNLQLLLSSLNFFILKNLRKSNILSEEQSEDFRLFVHQMLPLVKSLRQAGLMKAEVGKLNAESDKEPAIVSVAMNVDSAGILGVPTKPAESDPANATSAVLPMGSNDTEKNEVVDDLAKKADRTRGLETDCDDKPGSKTSQETGVAEREELFPVIGNDEDVPHVDDELLIRDVSPQRRNSKSRDTVDTESIYEAWMLETGSSDEVRPRPIAVVCGIKVKLYDEVASGEYAVVPYSKDKDMLKKIAGASAKKSHTESIGKQDERNLLNKTPKESHKEVKSLLRQRNHCAKKPYGWRLVAVEIQTRKWGLSLRKRQTKSSAKWMIILRGGIMEDSHKEKRPRDLNLPRRNDKPWGRPSSSQWRALDLDRTSSYESDSTNTVSEYSNQRRRRFARRVTETVEVRRERSPIRIVRRISRRSERSRGESDDVLSLREGRRSEFLGMPPPQVPGNLEVITNTKIIETRRSPSSAESYQPKDERTIRAEIKALEAEKEALRAEKRADEYIRKADAIRHIGANESELVLYEQEPLNHSREQITLVRKERVSEPEGGLSAEKIKDERGESGHRTDNNYGEVVEEDQIDDEEAERLMNEYLASFAKEG